MKKFIVLFLICAMVLSVSACGAKKENVAPTISGVQDGFVEAGSEFDAFAGVTASDEEDGDISSKITVEATPSLEFKNGKTTPANAGDYDPETDKIYMTVTASVDGVARVLKYTMDPELKNPQYEGILISDPTKSFWNLECSDCFQIGDKWYLTYSGQDDTLWYAVSDSRFGEYSEPVRLEGKLFYAAKQVSDGTNNYMVGWTRRSESPSSTQEVSAWGGNMSAQQIVQNADGTLALAPIDTVRASFNQRRELLDLLPVPHPPKDW